MSHNICRRFGILILVISALASFLVIDAAAGDVAYGAGKVSVSELNIRSKASTTASVAGTLHQDDVVVILSGVGSEWYNISYNGTVGYVAARYIKDVEKAKNFTASGLLTASDVRLRATPATSGSALGTYQSGTTVSVIGINNGWYKVKYDGKTGYIRSDLMKLTAAGQAKVASAVQTTAVAAVSPLSQQIADFAYQFIGYPYVYGAESPSSGFDCSGLAHYVYKSFGYKISRTASSQYRANGTSITKNDLLPGDLVFFSSNGGRSVTHVGVYYGNGMFVNASTESTGVIFSSLNSSWYSRTYYGAKRILS